MIKSPLYQPLVVLIQIPDYTPVYPSPWLNPCISLPLVVPIKITSPGCTPVYTPLPLSEVLYTPLIVPPR